MNRGVTIVYKDGVPQVHTGPEVPVREQLSAFKTLVQTGVEGCDRIELWTTGAGLAKRKKFHPAKVAPEPEAEPTEAEEAPEPEPEPESNPTPAKKQAKKGK